MACWTASGAACRRWTGPDCASARRDSGVQRRGWGIGCEMHGCRRPAGDQGAGQCDRQDERGRRRGAVHRRREPGHWRALDAGADRRGRDRREVRVGRGHAWRHRCGALGHRRLCQPHHLHRWPGRADGWGRGQAPVAAARRRIARSGRGRPRNLARRNPRARHRPVDQRARRGGTAPGHSLAAVHGQRDQHADTNPIRSRRTSSR